MSTSRPSRSLATLAEDLRRRDDDALTALLRARPDLLSPVPSDIASLAARATTRPSVQRALDHLDRFTLQVLETVCALPEPSDEKAVRRALGADPATALVVLLGQALVYRDHQGGLLVPRTVLDVVGEPAGLGPAAERALHSYGPRRLARLAGDLGLPDSGDPVRTAEAIAAALGDGERVAGLLATAPPG
ncbi:MAG: DNA-binding protein, partial [Actinomycetes bacterium]